MFASSIAENIRYGKPDATDAEIEKNAKLANAHDFIVQFPNRYQTIVGERGATLSGKVMLKLNHNFIKITIK